MKMGLIIFMLVVLSLLVGATSSLNYLSKNWADTLYCWVDGSNCALGGGGGGNFTLNVTGNEGDGEILSNEVFNILGDGNISTSMAANTLTIEWNGSFSLTDTNESYWVSQMLANVSRYLNQTVDTNESYWVGEILDNVTLYLTDTDTNESYWVSQLLGNVSRYLNMTVDTNETTNVNLLFSIAGDINTTALKNGSNSDITIRDINSTNLDINSNTTFPLNVSFNDYTCYNANCSAYIFYNGSAMVIQG